MPSVSIVVPIYNVEKYLKRCMDSLINQTLEDIEIILVDDGSTDSCFTACDEYAAKDKRIKVIHKKNGGLGLARNSGLEIAKGEYVAFADSDDYVSKEMYEKLYNEAKENNADTCICGSNRVYSAGNIGVFKNPITKGVYTKDRLFEDILINLLGSPPSYPYDDFVGMSVWKGIYSRNIIMKNKIRFCSEREFISEDIIFNLDYYGCAERVAVIPDAMYYHCENQSSLTTSYKANRFEKYKILYFELLSRVQELGILAQSKMRIERTFISSSRICITQEVINAGRNGVKKASKNIYSICSDDELQKVFKEYPIAQLPFKQRTFSVFTKLKMVKILFVLVRLNSRS